MLRQKRDKAERAFNKGYQVGRSGRSKDLCPHQESEARQQWLSGWREGRGDSWDGMTGIAGLHLLYNFKRNYIADIQ